MLKRLMEGILLSVIFLLTMASLAKLTRQECCGMSQQKNYTQITITSSSTPTAWATPTPVIEATSTPTPTPKSFPVVATAYNGVEIAGSNLKTRSKTPVKWGVVAIDPRVIPLGTRLSIDAFPGQTFIAEDTGGGVIGNHIDIWMPSIEQANAWGVKQVKVTVLD